MKITGPSVMVAGSIALLSSLLLVAFSACSPTITKATPVPPVLTPTITQSLEAGWWLHEDSAEGIAISLPQNWQRIEGQLTKPTVSRIIFKAGDSVAPTTGANLVINKMSSAIPVSLDDFAQESLRTLERQMPGLVKLVEHRRVDTPAGKAEEMRYQWNRASSDGQVATLAMLAYLVVNGRDYYVLTFGVDVEQGGRYEPIFQKMGAQLPVFHKVG